MSVESGWTRKHVGPVAERAGRNAVCTGPGWEGVMIRCLTITFLAGLALSVGGCAGMARTPRASTLESQPDQATQPFLERDGFAVLYFRAVQNEYDSISVIGEVKNVGPAARAVELQAALRDANGRLVAVGHFCPAAHRNIAPGDVWPFSYSFGRQQGIVHAELRIVGAFRTMDALDFVSTDYTQ
jgi:hypothetical protein